MLATPVEIFENGQKLDEYKKRIAPVDAAIEALSGSGAGDQLALSRLKKRKLQLKDEIAEINNSLLPDIIA